MASRPGIYEAQARVQVDLENPNPALGGASKNGSSVVVSNTYNDPTYFATKLQILTGPGLLRRVAKTLDLEHNQGFLRADNAQQPTVWQNVLRIFGLYRKPRPTSAPNDLPLRTEVASAVAKEDLEDASRLQPYVIALQENLTVEPVKETRLSGRDTRLIDISLKHTDPRIAAKIVNAIADTFALSNLEKKTEINTSTGDYLQKRIAELQMQIRNDGERLSNYAKNNQILSLDASQNTVVDRLSGLNKQLLEAENDRKIAEAAYRVKRDPAAAEILAGTGNNAGTKDLDAQLSLLKQKRAQLLVDNTEEWPEVKEVEKQIAALEKEIQDTRSRTAVTESETIEARYHQALDRENALRAAFDEQRGATRTQNEAAINYKIIQQEIDTNKGVLDGLLQRAKENDVELAGTPNNLHVTDYATAPRGPIGP